MLNIVFYFQVHQPYRLGQFGIFDVGGVSDPFDEKLNRSIIRKVSANCYIPANELLLRISGEYGNSFKAAFSITGTTVEQLRLYCPEVLDQFRKLSGTKSVEFLGETYYHSLFSLSQRDEFLEQVRMHLRLLKDEFGIVPSVFRNTELIYEDRLSDFLSGFDNFRVILTEGTNTKGGRGSSLRVHRSGNGLHYLLLRNFPLSDDIAFRFSNREWQEYPLTVDKFLLWADRLYGSEKTGDDLWLNIYLDYETFGEHHHEKTGIFQFLQRLPECILKHNGFRLRWPSEAAEDTHSSVQILSVHSPLSWADSSKDLSAWLSNDLQLNCFETLTRLINRIKKDGDGKLIQIARKLSSSDHFYYMYTEGYESDLNVHRYFSHYSSPEDAYICYVYALASLEEKISL
jgi:alpha-amylase